MSTDETRGGGGDPLSPTVRVVHAVAEVTGRDPMEMEPLYEVVDTDPLDELCAPNDPGDDRFSCTVQFEFAGHPVAVSSDGSIRVSDEAGTTHLFEP